MRPLSPTGLYWSRHGEVACATHAPSSDDPRWTGEDWAPIGSRTASHKGCGTSISARIARPMAAPSADSQSNGQQDPTSQGTWDRPDLFYLDCNTTRCCTAQPWLSPSTRCLLRPLPIPNLRRDVSQTRIDHPGASGDIGHYLTGDIEPSPDLFRLLLLRYKLNEIFQCCFESTQGVPSPLRACIGLFMAKSPARPTRRPLTTRAGPKKVGHRSPSRTAG